MARQVAGVASLVLGVFSGIVGFTFSRLSGFETLGLLAVGSGIVLFVLGIAWIAIGRTKA